MDQGNRKTDTPKQEIISTSKGEYSMPTNWNMGKIRQYFEYLSDMRGDNHIEIQMIEDEAKNYPFYGSENGILICNPRFFRYLSEIDGVMEAHLIWMYCLIYEDKRGKLDNIDIGKEVRATCELVNVKYLNTDQLEEHIRPVRHVLFTDPKRGGCYFRIGDVLRSRIPGGGSSRYIVRDIYIDDGKTMVTISRRKDDNPNNRWNYEEERLFKQFWIVE